jgi:hypothetical protein
MVVAINYSNKQFRKAASLNSFTAKRFGKVDKVISFIPEDIEESFRLKNSKIFENFRGDGLWLWKPYFIHKSLLTMDEGDYLVYVDSGICYLKNIEGLLNKVENSKQDIFFTEIPLLEVQYTHPEVFNILGVTDAKFSNQVQAALLIVKKTVFSMDFIEEWLNLCQDYNLLSGNFDSTLNESLFIDHREDQSLFSVLTKKYGLQPFKDCTDYGRFPLQYFNKNIVFRVPKYTSEFMVESTYFLSYRRANPYLYFFKFILKRAFAFFGFSRFIVLTDIANLK